MKKSNDDAVIKSIGFFLGCLADKEEISSFKTSKDINDDLELIRLYLEDKGLYIRERPIIKKYEEFIELEQLNNEKLKGKER